MSHVFVIDLSYAPTLKEELANRGFGITQPQYTLFQAKSSGVVVTFYQSGKLQVQGKKAQEIIEFLIEPLIGDFSCTYKGQDTDTAPHIGADEAGKGDFFGPLCVAAVFATTDAINELIKKGIKDSKTITDKKTNQLAPIIEKICSYELMVLFPKKYNELYSKINNLNHLLAWAHSKTITALVEKTKSKKVILDQFGPKHLVESRVKPDQLGIELIQMTKAESDVVVAAASILARKAFIDGIDLLGKKAGRTLPKGASSLVVDAGRDLARQGLPMDEFVKTHFKTMDQIQN